MMPGRLSRISKLKRPPRCQLRVYGEVLRDERFCVFATFGGTDFYDDVHDDSVGCGSRNRTCVSGL